MKKKTLLALLVALLFVLVHVPMLMSHEIWDDEGIVWGLSKEVNLSNIYDLNSVEPHPLLWQLILAPFSQAGFPIITMNIISLIFVALAVFLFVRFAPVGRFGKLAFLLSSAFFYFNPVIARDYALIPLAVVLVCLAYKSRHEKPLLYGLALAFLSQTHFLMFGLVAVLALGFLIEEFLEKKPLGKKLLSLAFCLLPLLLSILSSLPIILTSLENHAIINGISNHAAENPYTLLERTIGSLFGYYVSILDPIMIALAALIVLGFLAANLKAGLYLASAFGFWYFVMDKFYPNYYIMDQKVAILPLFLLFAIWLVLAEDNKKPNFLLKALNLSEIVKYLKRKMAHPAFILPFLIVLLTIPHAIYFAVLDLNTPYSSSKENAAFLNETIEKGDLLIEGDAPATTSLDSATYVQVDRDFDVYNVVFDSFKSYDKKLRYDDYYVKTIDEFESLGAEQIATLIEKFSEKYDHIYYVVTPSHNCKGEEIENETLSKYKKIKELNTGDYIGQSYERLYVYQVK